MSEEELMQKVKKGEISENELFRIFAEKDSEEIHLKIESILFSNTPHTKKPSKRGNGLKCCLTEQEIYLFFKILEKVNWESTSPEKVVFRVDGLAEILKWEKSLNVSQASYVKKLIFKLQDDFFIRTGEDICDGDPKSSLFFKVIQGVEFYNKNCKITLDCVLMPYFKAMLEKKHRQDKTEKT